MLQIKICTSQISFLKGKLLKLSRHTKLSINCNSQYFKDYSLYYSTKKSFCEKHSNFYQYINSQKSYQQQSTNTNTINNNTQVTRNPSQENQVYVSQFYTIDNKQIFQFLESVRIEYKIRPSGEIVTRYCPICPKPHHNKTDNQWTLNIKPNSGAFLCFRCGVKGSWFDFKNHIMGIDGIEQISNHNHMSNQLHTPPSSLLNDAIAQQPKLPNELHYYSQYQALINKIYPDIIDYLSGAGPESRGLSQYTLEKYQIGIGHEKFMNENSQLIQLPVIYFPMFAPRPNKQAELLKNNNNQTGMIGTEEYQLVRVKIRALGKQNKYHQRMSPAPGQWGLFGLNTIPEDAKIVVITEGEYDAMAVYQATSLPAISLPNGANHLPLQVLPWLERFERIYLWMDADDAGKSNLQAFAQKLGTNRTYVVNTQRYNIHGPKDANDALREDPESIKQYILEAKPLTSESLVTFQELRLEILKKIQKYEENVGIKSDYFDWFNKKLKGFRKGELTILTGGTGSGKTTLLSQLSLDFCRKGIGTLWGSFEVKNEVILTNMLIQYAGMNLIEEPERFEFYADQFEKLPLFFLKFFGSNDVDKIICTIEYAIYAYDIGHVVIDNLQFLLSGQGRGFEKFDIQDQAIAKLRHLATEKNIHVTLVIHPRKVDDGEDLNINSVFGTAKATQEADNVVIIQNRPKFKAIDIKKNRFDGETGRIALGFDKETKRYIELDGQEIIDLHNTPITIKEVIENRVKKGQLRRGWKEEQIKQSEQIVTQNQTQESSISSSSSLSNGNNPENIDKKEFILRQIEKSEKDKQSSIKAKLIQNELQSNQQINELIFKDNETSTDSQLKEKLYEAKSHFINNDFKHIKKDCQTQQTPEYLQQSQNQQFDQIKEELQTTEYLQQQSNQQFDQIKKELLQNDNIVDFNSYSSHEDLLHNQVEQDIIVQVIHDTKPQSEQDDLQNIQNNQEEVSINTLSNIEQQQQQQLENESNETEDEKENDETNYELNPLQPLWKSSKQIKSSFLSEEEKMEIEKLNQELFQENNNNNTKMQQSEVVLLDKIFNGTQKQYTSQEEILSAKQKINKKYKSVREAEPNFEMLDIETKTQQKFKKKSSRRNILEEYISEDKSGHSS